MREANVGVLVEVNDCPPAFCSTACNLVLIEPLSVFKLVVLVEKLPLSGF